MSTRLEECCASFDIKLHNLFEREKKEQTNYVCVLNVVQQENNLHKSDWRERFFDWIKVRDPFEPVVPEHLEIDNFFTAPFDYDRRDK